MELNNKKILFAAGGVIVILAAVIVVLLASNSKKQVISDVISDTQYASSTAIGDVNSATTVSQEEIPQTPQAVQALKEAVVVVPGTNPVSKNNQVLTKAGVEAVNNVTPNSPAAPKQSEPIKTEVKTTGNVLTINISRTGFSVKEFTVKAGAPVTLAFSQKMIDGHIIAFESPELSAITVSLGPNETRAITFNAPTQAGSYTFKCNAPGHAARGETGIMIVK